MTKTIYALLCPDSGVVRYVGQTSLTVGHRLARHITECYDPRTNGSKKNVWLSSILANNKIPSVMVLERVGDGCSWEAAEKRWIAHFRYILGDDLLNSSDGGQGNSGFSHSAETRAKISASGKARAPFYRPPPSEETKAKIAATLRGRPSPMTGKKHSPEALAKMAAARQGRKLSESHRAKLSEVRKGHPVSDEARAKIGAKVAAAAARKRAEKEAQT